jgi:DNA helicase II / ATP-dependent DNA helicase PcrA
VSTTPESTNIDLLTRLNPAQRAAVLHDTGPALVVAGAGSGKTRVLTHRLAYLIQQGKADPFQLLALTFTNKASRAMRERIEELIGPSAKGIVMGTFHSVFSRVLRAEAEKIGFTSDFTIYDEDDALSMIKAILKELNLDDKQYKPRILKNRISNAKNQLIDPTAFAQNWVEDELTSIAAKVYGLYQLRLLKANAMDFDDLLTNMVELFNRSPESLHRLQHRYRYIMVDEYQDTNHVQYVILKKLASVHENILAVGDDAQSIYSFRGASLENILNFQKDYPDLVIYKLEQNYRSTTTIVEAANGVIAKNERQISKTCFSENESGEPIVVMTAENEQEEARKVVDRIREVKMTRGFFNKDIGILYRTNAQSRVMEDELRRAGIIYKVFGGLSFYKRKEIKDVLAYLRLAINQNDEEAIKRVINYPQRGIGDTSVAKLLVGATENGLTLFEALQKSKVLGMGRAAAPLDEFVTLIKLFRREAEREDAWKVVDLVARQSGILKDLHRENTTESLSRWENVQELINAARQFSEQSEDKSLSAFLAEVSLFTDQDENANSDDFVSLMTIHASKGLEFKGVFVVGMEEDLFPSQMGSQTKDDLEEERRLFYVAITRAEKVLTLSHAQMRFRFGQTVSNGPSRFLDEVDARFVQRQGRPVHKPNSLDGFQRSFYGTPPNTAGNGGGVGFQRKARALNDGAPSGPTRIAPTAAAKLRPLNAPSTGGDNFAGDDLSSLAPGMKVEHFKFGIGTVETLDGIGGDARAIIDFGPRGTKTLILKYSRLKLVG